MDTVAALTCVMIIGGPIAWWIMRRSASFRTPAAANASRLIMALSLLLFLVACAMLLFSAIGSTTHNAGTWLWLAAGLLTIWATGGWRFALPAIVERWSARHEAMLTAQAEAGDAHAAHMLGLGLKLRRDYEPARRWLRVAAEAGLTDAQWELARLLDETEGPAAALPWLRAAADGGHLAAGQLLRGPYGKAD
ncbi:tetratricopeptide repeat protein [Catellatospora vulcania]|uniref:tetratricopeptide repeat protein n=1 Tax=Catellatospora vulcania TaxID=1460450 RepID=UPI0012D4B660|nr:sel1 repeat family protein [Catellatospora vulcania]